MEEKGLIKQFWVAVVAVALLIHVSVSVPFVVLHGITAACSDPTNANFTQLLMNLSGSQGSCLEIGDNGQLTSIFMPLTQQAEIACEKVKQMKELTQGYNIVGRSQGNLVARGLIEFCDGGPPVYNYISLGGPHAGISSVPTCGAQMPGLVCDAFDALLKADVYSEFVQDHFAPSGYFKNPMDMKRYLENSKYLPKLSNEIPNQRNSTYKDRFTSLHNLVLVKFQNDTIIIPNDSTWFGFYPDGQVEPVLPANQTRLYTEDWIGLKTLDAAGKVKFVSVPGGHLEMADQDVLKYIVPYLQNQS
ncbi:unnamed protein product [Arabidopsis arenosa]|uniref:Palmitoyl protein thioesterase n=2 Tax=Arabidopsis TaxID=3701 RepID=A0A8T1XD42_9BRAS|nr:Palmitoyl protein thioesterase [Arabidopsis thaliana x Arabidopsis arenosa]CAE6214677.1 unnamed protein product [Arabidopsis arenosa]